MITVIHINRSISEFNNTRLANESLRATTPLPGLTVIVAVDHRVMRLLIKHLGNLPNPVIVDRTKCRVVLEDIVLCSINLLPITREISCWNEHPTLVGTTNQLNTTTDKPC